MKNFAHLKTDSPFYPVFANGMAPIQNILVPQRAQMQGAGVHEFYRLDVAKLSAEQLLRIANMVAAQCGGKPEEVQAHMIKEGFIPLRAMHVSSVSTDSMAFL